MYRSLHGSSPLYLVNSCTPTADIAGRQHLWSASQQKLIVPRYRLNSFGRRCFALAVPSTWPDSLRDPAPSLNMSAEDILFCEISTRCTQSIRNLLIMRYINLHFTYLLTYSLFAKVHKKWKCCSSERCNLLMDVRWFWRSERKIFTITSMISCLVDTMPWRWVSEWLECIHQARVSCNWNCTQLCENLNTVLGASPPDISPLESLLPHAWFPPFRCRSAIAVTKIP